MAWAMAKPSFFFQGLSNLPSSKTFIYQSLIFHQPFKNPTFTSPVHYIHKPQIQHQFPLVSVDVSKEDKPLSNEPSSPDELKIDRLHLEERLAVLNTGIYECQSCGYLYNEAIGDPSYPIPPGFGFDKLPEDWRCSTCGAAKSFFESKSVEIAGFVQNQNFGFGTNTLTGGQKLLLIYGSLLLAFALFLSGYFLQ